MAHLSGFSRSEQNHDAFLIPIPAKLDARTKLQRASRALARREVYEAARDMQLHRGQVQVALAEFGRAEERYVRANEGLQELEVSLQVRSGFGGVEL